MNNGAIYGKDSWFGNGPRKYKLKAALVNYKQEGDFVNIYYLWPKKILDELDNYIKLPTTVPTEIISHITTTEIISHITKERDEEKVYQFLMG